MATESKTGSQSQPQAAQGGSLLDEILTESRIKPTDEGYDVARKGVAAFIAEMLAPSKAAEKVDRTAVDAMIAELDRRLSAQVNEILHHPDVQKLESAWRSLRWTVERIDFRENIRVEMLSVDKGTLQADFEDAPDITKSGFYKIVYSNEYGVFGGKPFGVMNVNFDFGPGPQDVELLRKMAAVGAMSHVPVLANASAEFFGDKSFQGLPNLKDLKSLFEGPQYARWRGFRESEDARYVGLAMPRFLLRQPYGEKTVPVKAFNFTEDVVDHHDRYLYASNALVTRIADSFAKFRWSPNIIGPQSGGSVDALPLHQYEAMGEIQTKIPTEILLTERREFELSEEGFIGMVFRKDADNACFFSANSVQKPKTFGNSADGKLHVRDDPARSLHQGPAAGADRQLEGSHHPRAGAQQLGLPVRLRDGRPVAGRAIDASAAGGADHRRGRGRAAGVVPLQPEGPPSFQVHGGVVHAVAGGEAGQGVTGCQIGRGARSIR
jgi:type VI secretion system protein ImpC